MPMTGTAEQLYRQALSRMKEEEWLAAITLLKHRTLAVENDWRVSWNLGWSYFKLERFDYARRHMIRAAQLAPGEPSCRWGLGNVYLKRGRFKKAEIELTESLKMRESHLTRIALALACLSQGKLAEAEKIHLDGIELDPKRSEKYESYAAFLSDVGREAEAQAMSKKAKRLQRIN
jgi:Flp pilus assembly protein TadD